MAGELDRLFYFHLDRGEGIELMKTSCASSINKNSDGALVTATKGGDMQAFEELVTRHERKALLIAQRITRNREDAEDVVQESFHKAYRHLRDFAEKARFSTWLTRIVMNEAYMLLRRRHRVMEVLPENSEDGMEMTPEPFVDQNPNPEETYWRREREELVTAAVNRLRPTIRKTILLCDLEERSAEETAQILGTSIGAVKARLFQARQKLRRTLNPRVAA
jgi:RNA polymerase sigma-70 factor (ECF subfamily)